MAPTDTGCARRLDRTSVRTGALLLAKAESTDSDAETLAFVEGTYRLLGRLLAPAPATRAARPAHARASYSGARPTGHSLDISL